MVVAEVGRAMLERLSLEVSVGSFVQDWYRLLKSVSLLIRSSLMDEDILIQGPYDRLLLAQKAPGRRQSFIGCTTIARG